MLLFNGFYNVGKIHSVTTQFMEHIFVMSLQ